LYGSIKKWRGGERNKRGPAGHQEGGGGKRDLNKKRGGGLKHGLRLNVLLEGGTEEGVLPSVTKKKEGSYDRWGGCTPVGTQVLKQEDEVSPKKKTTSLSRDVRSKGYSFKKKVGVTEKGDMGKYSGWQKSLQEG